jgi:hypothetical protein
MRRTRFDANRIQDAKQALPSDTLRPMSKIISITQASTKAGMKSRPFDSDKARIPPAWHLKIGALRV